MKVTEKNGQIIVEPTNPEDCHRILQTVDAAFSLIAKNVVSNVSAGKVTITWEALEEKDKASTCDKQDVKEILESIDTEHLDVMPTIIDAKFKAKVKKP